MRFRPMLKQFFWVLVLDCILLGYLGSQEPQAVWHLGGIEVSLLWVARIGDLLLLRLLLGDPAARRPDRNTETIARQHRQGGARPRRARRPRPSKEIHRCASLSASDCRLSRPRSFAGAGRSPATANGRSPVRPRMCRFSFEGPFGTYDRAALQRGFQVYKEVCSACHSLNCVAFHALADPGGPGLHRGPGQGHRRRLQDPGRPQRAGPALRRQWRAADAARHRRPIISRRPSRTRRRPAPPTTARCRPICR